MNLVTVVGVQPQFIKAEIVSRPLRQRHIVYLIYTGQHYDNTFESGWNIAQFSFFAQRGCFDVMRIQQLNPEPQNGNRDISFLASRWLTAELWFRQFIDNNNIKL